VNYADNLPEDAAELVKTEESGCICRWDWIADPKDTDFKGFRKYPRCVIQITFLESCPYGDHSNRAGSKRIVDLWHENG